MNRKPMPSRLEERIEAALQQCRTVNKETPENILCYSCVSVSNATKAGNQLCFKGYNSPDAFMIIIYNDEEDWKQLRYKLIFTDEKIPSFVVPIIEKYIKDMWDFYQNPGE